MNAEAATAERLASLGLLPRQIERHLQGLAAAAQARQAPEPEPPPITADQVERVLHHLASGGPWTRHIMPGWTASNRPRWAGLGVIEAMRWPNTGRHRREAAMVLHHLEAQRRIRRGGEVSVATDSSWPGRRRRQALVEVVERRPRTRLIRPISQNASQNGAGTAPRLPLVRGSGPHPERRQGRSLPI